MEQTDTSPNVFIFPEVPATAPHGDEHADSMASQPSESQQDARDDRKVTFIVGGMDVPSRTPSPTAHLSPGTRLITMATGPLEGNINRETLLPDTFRGLTTTSASSSSHLTATTHAVKAVSETKQTFTARETTTTSSESVRAKMAFLEVTGDKSMDTSHFQSDKVSLSREVSRGTHISVAAHETSEVSATEEHTRDKTDLMQIFAKQESEFRDLFLSKSIMDLSEQKLVHAAETGSLSVSTSPAPHIVGLDHLDNLVRLMEQLSALRDENMQLRRKCSYLENTKSLLQMRTEMVETKLHHHHQQETIHEHSSSSSSISGHHRFFSHHHARAKSLISKQQAKIMHYLSAPSPGHLVGHPSPSPSPRPSLEKSPSDGGVVDISQAAPTPSPEPASPTPPKLHVRSQSVGSIEMVDLDLKTTVMELDTMASTTSRAGVSKSMTFRRGDFKASKKLQEKWERVKKVFGGKPESGTSPGGIGSGGTAAASAGVIVRANTRPLGLRKKPPSLTHMGSVDGCGRLMTLDTLKPSDRTLSKSNPQLSEVPPHTPSSTQSEPPGNLPSPGPDDDHVTEESDKNIDTSSSTPSTTKNQTFFSSPIDDNQQHVQERLSRISSSTSSESSYDSDEAEVFHDQATTISEKTTPSRPTASVTGGSSSSDKQQYLSVSPILPRRRSSPSLAALEGGDEHGENSVPPSPLSRSSSDKCPRGSVDLDSAAIGSLSMPSTPVFSDGEISRRRCPYRPGASKKPKSAWGRVKKIIHTRKDSLKRKSYSPGRTEGESDRDSSPVPATSDDEKPMEGASSLPPDTRKEPSPSRTKQDKSSPILIPKTPRSLAPSVRGSSPESKKNLSPSPQSPDRSSSPGPQGKSKRESIAQAIMTGSPADLVALMGVSEEYQKKMQLWEDKKRKGLTKAGSFAIDVEQLQHDQQSKDDVTYSKSFIKKMEEWEQKKGLAAQPLMTHGSLKETTQTSPGPLTPRDRSPVAGIPDKEPQLSESFSKRVQEWERVRTTRKVRDGKTTSRSPEGRSSRPVHRSRSRERDRSSSKFDKELKTKIEKKEQRIRRDQMKLEKMKQKLEAASANSSGSESRGDHALPPAFLRKLHQWEDIKGLTSSAALGSSHGLDISAHHTRSQSSRARQFSKRSLSRDRVLSDGAIKPLSAEKVESLLQQAPTDEATTAGDSAHLHPKRQDSFIERLKTELEDKEDEISFLRDDLSQLTERINEMNKEHSEEIGNYRRELWASSKMGRYTIESDLLSAQLRELELQVSYLQDYSQRLAKDKRRLHMRVQEQSKGRNLTETKMAEELLKIQMALDVKSEVVKIGSSEGLKRLYTYLLKAQDQLKELHDCLHQRNDLLEDMQRHLLVQEVTNKLLAADIQRRENDILYLKDSRRHGIIRRWKTFHGNDFCSRGDGRYGDDKHPPLLKPQSSQLHSSATEIQQSLKQLKHYDYNSNHLPQEWVQDARNQLVAKSKGMDGLETKHVAVQTSMDTASITSSASLIHPHGIHRSVQTSFLDLPAAAASEAYVPDPHVATERKREIFHEHLVGSRQPSLTGDAIARDQIERLIQQYRTQDGGASSLRLEHVSQDTSPDKSPAACRKPKLSGTSVYSEWLRRDFRQPRLDHRKVVSCDQDEDGRAAGYDKDVRPKIPQPPPTQTDSTTPQLLHSPVIRSKHPRKIKASETRLEQLTWKTHPPKHQLRPTRQSTVDAPNIEELHPAQTTLKDNNVTDVENNGERSRTLSDSFMPSEIDEALSGIAATKKYGSLDRSDDPLSKIIGVKNLVSRFEKQSIALSSGQTRRASPTPLAISPVRRLKTAKELLNESASSQRSRSISREHRGWTPPREKLPSCSSDKENDKDEGTTSAQTMLQKFLLAGEAPATAQFNLKHQTRESENSPLKDRTFDVGRNGGSDNGKLGESSSVSETVDLSGRMRSNTHPGSKRPEQTPPVTSSLSCTPHASPIVVRSGVRAQSFNVPPVHGSSIEELSSSPWQLQEVKASGGKRSPLSLRGTKSTGKGAISALCMQTMSVSLDKMDSETSTSSPGSGKERKGKTRGRLLDVNWLQKPRRFFKTSKS